MARARLDLGYTTVMTSTVILTRRCCEVWAKYLCRWRMLTSLKIG